MRNRVSLYYHRMLEVDTDLCLRLNRTSQRIWVRRLFRTVSRFGDGAFWYALIAVILLAEGADGLRPSLHMLAAGFAGTVCYKLIKGKASRPRPYEVSQLIAPGIPPLDRFSFPSGHTLHAVVFSMVALGYYPMLAWLLLPFTLLVGMSRVILGLHYPTDVLAGAAIGALIASMSFML